MMIKRRTLLVGAASTLALPAVFTGKGNTADFKLRYAHNLPTTHPMHLRAVDAVAKIKEETGGKVEIGIFPNNQLGGDTDMLSQLRAGGINFFTLSGLILSNLIPVTSINGIAFAFNGYDDVWKAMDGELGEHVRKEIRGAGLVVLDKMWDSGFRQVLSNSAPINGPEDLVGLKIRVPVSPLWTSLFTAFRSLPTSINFNEVYSALESNIVNATENPISVINLSKLYEVTKYCSLTNHMWDGFHFLANRASWEQLPSELSTVIAKHFNEAALLQRADVAAAEAVVGSELEAKGLVFNKPDPAPFRETLVKAGFYADWKAKFGEEAWAALEKTAGKLG